MKLIERTVCALIHPKEEDEEPRLRFITGGMLSTAELSILQARKEIHLFAERTHRMFGMVQDLLHTEKGAQVDIPLTFTVKAEHLFGEWTSNGDGTHTRHCKNST